MEAKFLLLHCSDFSKQKRRRDYFVSNTLINRINCYGNVVKINTKKKYLVSFLIEHPEHLPEKIKDKIFKEFYPVALSAFNGEDSELFKIGVYKHLFNVGILMLVFDISNDGLSVAFRTCTFLNYSHSKILYIEGTAIAVEYHGQGIYQELTKKTMGNVDFVVSRTQNPVVITALSRLFKNVYPITVVPDAHIKNIAKYVSCYLKMSNYEYNNMIGRKTYHGILTNTLPKTNNDIEKKVLELINPVDGDSLILVCPV